MPSAVLNKFDCFLADLTHRVHNLHDDALMVLLTNAAPAYGDTVVDTTTSPCTLKSASGAVEVTDGDGYTKGGNAAAFSSDGQTGGVYRLILTSPATWTASPGSVGPFRYAVLYNASAGVASARPVVGWYDYGQNITMSATETFTVALDQVNGVLTIA